MNQIKYYYRLKPIGIDNFDVNDVKKNNQELNDFEVLSSQFELLKKSFETLTKDRADIFVCVLPEDANEYLNSVVEISVYHKIKRKLFSKEIKQNCFSICITIGTASGIDLCFYDSVDFNETKNIFYDYVVNQKIPDMKNWDISHL